MSRSNPPRTPAQVMAMLPFAADVFPLFLDVPECIASSLMTFASVSPVFGVLDVVCRLQRSIIAVALGCVDGERKHPDHMPPGVWLKAAERRQLAVAVFKELDANRGMIRASPRVWFKSSPIELPDWYPQHLDGLITSHAGFEALHALRVCLDVPVTSKVAYSGVRRQTELIDACVSLMPHLGNLSRPDMVRGLLFAYADGAAKFSCA